MSDGVSIDEVVDSYSVFLARNRYLSHLQAFKHRLQADPKAAEAEAIVFALLRSEHLHPDIFEDASKGGPDFSCQPDKNNAFLVEVTSLDSKAVAKRSSWPDKIDDSGGAFRLITEALSGAAASKAAQLAGYSCSRVLAITCSHVGAGAFMGRLAAVNLLVSDPKIHYRLGDPPDRVHQITDLRKAVFFRPDKTRKKIIPFRQSISAILLIAIFGDQARVVGLLHPQPAVSFNPSLFPRVPYVRLSKWPIMDGRMEIEWFSSGQNPATFYYTRIQ